MIVKSGKTLLAAWQNMDPRRRMPHTVAEEPATQCQIVTTLVCDAHHLRLFSKCGYSVIAAKVDYIISWMEARCQPGVDLDQHCNQPTGIQ